MLIRVVRKLPNMTHGVWWQGVMVFNEPCSRKFLDVWGVRIENIRFLFSHFQKAKSKILRERNESVVDEILLL